MKKDADVFVIGAGPAGLTAAYCLSKQGVPVIVAEKDPTYVGGISRTVNYNGYLFDIGGHRFFSKSQAVVDLWNEILPNDFIERPRLSRIFYDGNFYSYPLNAFEALTNLGILNSTLCMLSFAYAKAFPIKNPTNFYQWVRNQFGERLFSIFFKTYTEKVWGMKCEEISADWAAQRIKGLDLRVAIIDAIKRAVFGNRGQRRNTNTVKTLIGSFQYPRRGPGMMWDAAAAKIQERGGKLLMGRALKSASYLSDEDLWVVEVIDADGKVETYSARHLVSSAAIHDLMPRLTPKLQSSAHAGCLRYRDFLTVALVVNRPDLFSDNWIYIHDPSVRVGRIQNFRSWSPEMVKAGTTCLGLEYFCCEGDSLWTSPDEELVKLAVHEIVRIGLIDRQNVIDACVVRQLKAYPVYDADYQLHVDAIREEVEAQYPTLHLIGRNGMHKYNNQDHAMMTGMLTAKNILLGKRRYDVWGVNEDAEYHEAGLPGAEQALQSERLVPEAVQI